MPDNMTHKLSEFIITVLILHCSQITINFQSYTLYSVPFYTISETISIKSSCKLYKNDYQTADNKLK